MPNQNEQVDVLDEPIEAPNDATDWEARAKELENKITRGRDSRKSLKEKYESEIAELKTKLEAKSDPNKKDEKADTDSKLLKKIEKISLRAAGISEEDEVNLALTTAKKWDMDIDEIVADEDFKSKLEKLRNAKANATATSRIKGGQGRKGNDDLEYYIQRFQETGEIPQINDKKLLAAFTRAQMNNSKAGKRFYND